MPSRSSSIAVPVSCRKPVIRWILAPPAGVVLETPEQVLRQVEQIKQVVANGYMPLGNVTQMTDEERTEIANWSP